MTKKKCENFRRMRLMKLCLPVLATNNPIGKLSQAGEWRAANKDNTSYKCRKYNHLASLKTILLRSHVRVVEPGSRFL